MPLSFLEIWDHVASTYDILGVYKPMGSRVLYWKKLCLIEVKRTHWLFGVVSGKHSIPPNPEEFHATMKVATIEAPNVAYKSNVSVENSDYFAVDERMRRFPKGVGLVQQHDVRLVSVQMNYIFVSSSVVGREFDAHDPVSIYTVVFERDIGPVQGLVQVFEILFKETGVENFEKSREKVRLQISNEELSMVVLDSADIAPPTRRVLATHQASYVGR
jgi:hypothetical protein